MRNNRTEEKAGKDAQGKGKVTENWKMGGEERGARFGRK